MKNVESPETSEQAGDRHASNRDASATVTNRRESIAGSGRASLSEHGLSRAQDSRGAFVRDVCLFRRYPPAESRLRASITSLSSPIKYSTSPFWSCSSGDGAVMYRAPRWMAITDALVFARRFNSEILRPSPQWFASMRWVD